MMKFIRSTPLAISGLSLAFAALGNLLLPYGIVFRYLCGFLSAILFILFALKVFLDSPHAKAEFKTPDLSEQGYNLLAPIAVVSEWIAIGIVLYVLIHYIRFFRFVLAF